jgi:hypothetical protein
MVCCTWKNHVFGLCSYNVSWKNTTFRKLDPFPSSGKIMVALALLGPLERASLNHWSTFWNMFFFQETLGDGQSPKTWYFQMLHQYQNCANVVKHPDVLFLIAIAENCMQSWHTCEDVVHGLHVVTLYFTFKKLCKNSVNFIVVCCTQSAEHDEQVPFSCLFVFHLPNHFMDFIGMWYNWLTD